MINEYNKQVIVSRVGRLTGIDRMYVSKYSHEIASLLDFPEERRKTFDERISAIDARKSPMVQRKIDWGVPVNERMAPDPLRNIERLNHRTEQDVNNFYSTLDSLLNYDWHRLGLTEKLILELQAKLMGQPTARYKDKPNDIILWDKDNPEKRIERKTTPPGEVKKKIAVLVRWADVAMRIQAAHPLYIISVFSYEFLFIHPFNDGNGRMCRLLMILLLLKNGYEFIKYGSLDKWFEENRRL